MDDTEVRARNEATVRAVLALITAGEYEALAGHVTEDLHFELPYAAPPIPGELHGRDMWDTMQRQTFALFSSFRNEPRAFYPSTDPNVLVAEYESDAVVKRNGKAYRNRYVGIFRFRDGRICAWREYHNPEATSVIRSG
jgi:ketosteroid isomerase-like protein